MARQTLTKRTAIGNYPTLPITADSLDVTMTAADAVVAPFIGSVD